MKDIPIEFLEDKVREIVEHIFAEGQGILLELDAAPTATSPLLNEDQIGLFENKLYWRKGDVLYRYDSDAQTTITNDEV